MGHPPFGHNGESALAALASAAGPLACGGFEGNAQSLRLLTRLEPKVAGAGLNLTRAALDAALKYPWAGTSGKYGAYESDLAVFSWIRQDAPSGRRCLEAQVMDWADDVAYSVHDVEDGLHAGLIALPALRAPAERAAVAGIALASYCKPQWLATAAELEAVFGELMVLPFWQFPYDGGLVALAAVKNLTSELVGRFCVAAEAATLAAHRDPATAPRLTRYAADLVVPRQQLLECALLKAVAAHYVMGRAGAAAQQAGEREVITELALEIYDGAPATLDPVLRPSWESAPSDTERRRVVIDQVASLTDTSAIAWHRRLCS
jgi:dGTPase